jgi:hypothetical protein
LGGARIGDAKLRDAEWVDDDNLLATISSTGPPPLGFTGSTREWYQLVNFNVSKPKVSPLSFEISRKRTFNVVEGETAVRDVAGRSMLFVPGTCVEDRTVPCLFSFSYPERRTRLIDEGSEPDTDWLMDESGRIAAKFVYHDDKKLWEIKTHKDNRWTLVASGTAAIDTPRMLGFGADGAALIVRFTENGDGVWKPLNLKDNTWGAPLEKGAAFSRVIEERKSGRIIGGVHGIGSSQYVFESCAQSIRRERWLCLCALRLVCASRDDFRSSLRASDDAGGDESDQLSRR